VSLWQRITCALRARLQGAAFVIALQEGDARCVRGKVDRSFLYECRQIARREGLADGRIYGFREGKRIRLSFAGIPQRPQQHFRNAWASL